MTTDEFISLMKSFSNYITISYLDNKDKNNISLTYRMNDIDGLHCSFVIVKYDFIDNTYTLYTPHKFKCETYYDESNKKDKLDLSVPTNIELDNNINSQLIENSGNLMPNLINEVYVYNKYILILLL